MNSRWTLIAGNILVLLLLLVLVESVSFLLLKNRYPERPFLVCFSKDSGISELSRWLTSEGSSYHQVDPLLGYSATDTELKIRGFKTASECVVLKTMPDSSDGLKLFITGGSTTDLNAYSDNWPVELTKILRDNRVKATIYIGAASGYNSGQELLKLIRDGIDIAPLIHISYSGTNEVNAPDYVSSYEQSFFARTYRAYSALLPSTILLLRELLGVTHRDVFLRPRNKEIVPQVFWSKNMRMMHGIAESFGYRFIGILQPVLGSGRYSDPSGDPDLLNLHKKFYPGALQFVNEHPDYMSELTTVFDTAQGKVFIDNCHLNHPYQRVIALNIYEILKQRNLLN